MLINILGAPSSGKTTVSAMVFGELKQTGIFCEFITEMARIYIAEKKFKNKSNTIDLTNEDQVKIMEKQFILESIMNYSMPKGIIVSDSSPLNTLLYLSKEHIESEHIKSLVSHSIKHIDLLVYSPLTDNFIADDPNRIQNYEQAQLIEEKIPYILEIINKENSELVKNLVILEGNESKRKEILLQAIFDKMS